MRNLIEFETSEGKRFLVEALEGESDFASRKVDDLVGKAGITLNEALVNVMPAVEAVAKSLEAISRKPEDIEVEFGLKLATNVGAIFAKLGGEAHFKIKVKW